MDANFVLAKNIDMKDFSFKPIGIQSEQSFKGSLDSKGFVIQNLNITSDEFDVVSMFYKTEGAKFNNLIFDSVTLNTNNINSTTALITGTAIDTIIECFIVVDLNINSKSLIVGGIVGNAENTNISQAAVYGYITTDNSLVGGIAAIAENTNIENCSVMSNITSKDKAAGFVYSAKNVNVTTSYSYSKLDAPNKLGLIEKNSTNKINDSFYNKTVAKIDETSDDAKTSEEFSTSELFKNWSIDTSGKRGPLIWKIVVVGSSIILVAGVAYLISQWIYMINANDVLTGDKFLRELESKIERYIEKEFVPEEKVNNPVEVVFIVDSSNKMTNQRLALAETIVGQLSEKLYENNKIKIGLIDFSSGATWLSKITPDKVAFKQSITEIKDSVDTNNPRAFDAIVQAINGFHGLYYEMPYSTTPYANKDDGIDRHIVLLTSGKTADTDLAYQKVSEILENKGIYFNVINIPAVKDQLLTYFSTMSEKTNGLVRNIDINSSTLDKDKGKAIDDMKMKIVGVKNTTENIEGILLFTGH